MIKIEVKLIITKRGANMEGNQYMQIDFFNVEKPLCIVFFHASQDLQVVGLYAENIFRDIKIILAKYGLKRRSMTIFPVQIGLGEVI